MNQAISSYFGENVFSDEVMREYLPREVYEDLKRTLEEHSEIRGETAAAVAEAMKTWAVERGATHFTHWFQPMTNGTAEKHDSFIGAPKGGRVIEEFSAKELMKGEPDASSLPSGGLRATFEARGYTAWDCTSPAFIKNDPSGKLLCIPTAFCSFNGDALDQKTPLLRSMQALDTEAVRLLKLLGHEEVKHVIPSVGAEQEYFLVDREKFLAREDLVFAGRTLFGASAPKGQEMDDHYFGSIRERIGAFMKDVNEVLWRLGVPAKTQHNETAPAQHELASIYSEANLSTDQNQIVMDTLKRVAYRHGLHCLLNEKPFEGINGSGKHNNWSLTTDTGVNLLEPGTTPHENSQFLLFFTAVLAAVDRHGDLLRASAAIPGNDLRLGGSEAPPVIISAFIGDQMADVLNQLVDIGEATHSLRGHRLKTGVSSLPVFVKDATDRNRTSPFAFTGNKFEFRMVGSSDSVAPSTTVLNTITAEILSEIADELEQAEDVQSRMHEIICRLATEHRRIVFNGNSYSAEWAREAARRGLPNLPAMVDAVPCYATPENAAMFARFKVFNQAELESRVAVKLEEYGKTIRIEARTMVDIARREILPAGFAYLKELAETMNACTRACPALNMAAENDVISYVSEQVNLIKEESDNLKRLLEKADTLAGAAEKARFYRDRVVPSMQRLRTPADRLEMAVPQKLWPFPTYRELLFEV